MIYNIKEIQKILDNKTSRMYCIQEIDCAMNDIGIILYSQNLYEAKSFIQEMTGKIYSDIKINKAYDSKYEQNISYMIIKLIDQHQFVSVA